MSVSSQEFDVNSLQLIVSANEHGTRIDKYLFEFAKMSSRAFVQNLIENGYVLVNKKSVLKCAYKLKTGDKIEVQIPPTKSTELTPLDFKLDIYYEDEDLLVLNKESGMVVHPSHGHENDTLVNALLYHCKNLSLKNQERPGIVHRIDKETSGLLVIAKNDFTHEKLAEQFKNRSVHRIYFAVGIGKLNIPSGSIESYLARHIHDRKRYASIKIFPIGQKSAPNQNGKWAKTHFETLAEQSPFYYLKLQLETGRTHQIRVHLSEQSCPLLGDKLYGAYKKNSLIKDLILRKEVSNLNRFYLHAAELGFLHPRKNEKLLFKAPWPVADSEFIKKIFSNFNPLIFNL